MRCWGRNGWGELGLGHRTLIGDDELPSSSGFAALGDTASEIFVGRAHTCAYLDNGSLRCWGANSFGELGLGHQEFIGDDELPSSAAYVSF